MIPPLCMYVCISRKIMEKVLPVATGVRWQNRLPLGTLYGRRLEGSKVNCGL